MLGEKAPAPHCVHALADVPGMYVPAPHRVQVVRPTASVYPPFEHAPQPPPAVLPALPSGQSLHVRVDPPGLCFPAVQVMQAASDWAVVPTHPTMTLPDGQRLHARQNPASCPSHPNRKNSIGHSGHVTAPPPAPVLGPRE